MDTLDENRKLAEELQSLGDKLCENAMERENIISSMRSVYDKMRHKGIWMTDELWEKLANEGIAAIAPLATN